MPRPERPTELALKLRLVETKHQLEKRSRTLKTRNPSASPRTEWPETEPENCDAAISWGLVQPKLCESLYFLAWVSVQRTCQEQTHYRRVWEKRKAMLKEVELTFVRELDFVGQGVDCLIANDETEGAIPSHDYDQWEEAYWSQPKTSLVPVLGRQEGSCRVLGWADQGCQWGEATTPLWEPGTPNTGAGAIIRELASRQRV